jgi:lipopolysaccharide transport system ATP-binding protein
MSAIIEVSNLSKSYTLAHEGKETYTTLRDVMANKAKKIFSFPRTFSSKISHSNSYKEEFWALRDVNFEIEKGDRVGVIGRNGAGKSTLLKILSRIVEPTSGSIKIKGRVASLLEVGTGFHPELTGRENVFLNGAILGMSRSEIRKKFDEIVDFAEVEKFLDTPVKRYSSGMYVRLAFAVAAHLEPEILIVDEVLAVGDAQFQKKCLGKMEDVSKNEGRTVLFVSHNMSAISSICTKGIYLKQGKTEKTGNINQVILHYLNASKALENDGLIPEGLSIYNTGIVRFTRLKMKSISATENTIYYLNEIVLETSIFSQEEVNNIILDLRICDEERKQIVHLSNIYNLQNNIQTLKRGENAFIITIPNFMQPGSYSITIGAHQEDGTSLDYVENVLGFEVLTLAENEKDNYKFNNRIGLVHLESSWIVMG